MPECSFPFGRPLKPHDRQDQTPRSVLVMGAYPSALHVAWRWSGPDGESHSIQALPVDNEPEPFWDGGKAAEYFDAWKADGAVKVVGDVALADATFNGSSGVALDRDYLGPLGISRSDAWITDALATYRMSDGVKKAIEERLTPVLQANGLPAVDLPTHPSEGQIVKEATGAERLAELAAELRASHPSIVITLGNAALRVFRSLAESASGPSALQRDGYGQPIDVEIEVRSVRWYPVTHPGAVRTISDWQETHNEWREAVAAR